MNTIDLAKALARDAGPQRGGIVARRIAIAASAGLLAAIVLVPALFGFRNDLSTSLLKVAFKALFGLVGALAAAPFLLEAARPNVRVAQTLLPAALFAGASVVIAILTFIITPPSARMDMWIGAGVPECLYRIPLLALPIAIALVLAVRGLGATRLTLVGGAIGAASGSLGAIAYASCCPMDSALYVASWYLAAILGCAAAGALVAGRALRW